ncbi:hypothetical protein B0H10DRAFT_2053366 [Mycena sp. CBHHK59/15]|nr:hypothetical protein B0H10DRAFT_2053366 [Mycena sp. CBHHK59/15]
MCALGIGRPGHHHHPLKSIKFHAVLSGVRFGRVMTLASTLWAHSASDRPNSSSTLRESV